jgi:hypothetical protein
MLAVTLTPMVSDDTHAVIGSLDTESVARKNMLDALIRSISQVATAVSVAGIVISRRGPGEGDEGADVGTTTLRP